MGGPCAAPHSCAHVYSCEHARIHTHINTHRCLQPGDLSKGLVGFNATPLLLVKLIRSVQVCMCVSVCFGRQEVSGHPEIVPGENKAVSRSLLGLFRQPADSFINLLTNGRPPSL